MSPSPERVRVRPDPWPDPPAEARLWRYLSLAKFESLISDKAVYFCQAQRLEDAFEGTAPPTNRAVRPALLERYPQFRPWIEPLDAFEAQARRETYLNCWFTGDDEDPAMWQAYADGGRGVAIRSSVAALRDALVPGPAHAVMVLQVRYIDRERERFVEIGNTIHWYVHKDRRFATEREIRAITIHHDPAGQPVGIKDPGGPLSPSRGRAHRIARADGGGGAGGRAAADRRPDGGTRAGGRGAGVTRRRTLREDYFAELTAANGYDFGFLLADGTMDRGHNSVRIELAAYDRDALEGMRSRLGSDAHIAIRKRVIAKKPRTQVSVGWSSRRLCADLLRLGIGPGKDFQDYALPSVSRDAAPSVVRGLFDGDGTAVRVLTRKPTGVKLVIYGREKTLEWVGRIIQTETGVHGTIYPARRRTQFAYTVIRHDDVVRLANWMYADGGPSLERKRAKITSLIAEREAHLGQRRDARTSLDEKVAALYGTGREVPAIAAELGLGESVVLDSVRRQDLHHRKRYARVDFPLARRVRDLRAGGTAIPGIAKALDLSVATVRKLLYDDAYIEGLRLKSERDAEIMRLRAQGLLLKDIALRLGLATNTVLARLCHRALTTAMMSPVGPPS